MSWQSEFGDAYRPPKELLALVKSGEAQDESWHNDAAPKFSREFADSRYVTLWADSESLTIREIPGGKRFWVTNDQGDGGSVVETDDIKEAIKVYRELCDKEEQENPLVGDLLSLRDGSDDGLGRLLLRAARALKGTARIRLALAALVDAHDQKPSMLTAKEWDEARSALGRRPVSRRAK